MGSLAASTIRPRAWFTNLKLSLNSADRPQAALMAEGTPQVRREGA